VSEREPVLCYVDGGVLYFTTQPLSEQWGDDWDDVPYEHNAGRPYTPFNEPDGKHWEIVALPWSGDFELPNEETLNSPYSVQHLNARAHPWLQSHRWGPNPFAVKIWAGWTIRQVVQAIIKGGGMVYAPVDGSADKWLKSAE
jgi:hypothetical protein